MEKGPEKQQALAVSVSERHSQQGGKLLCLGIQGAAAAFWFSCSDIREVSLGLGRNGRVQRFEHKTLYY